MSENTTCAEHFSDSAVQLPTPPQPPSMDQAWKEVFKKLDSPSKALLKTASPITIHGSTLMVGTPNEFTRQRIEEKLRGFLEEALSDIFHKDMHLAFTVDPGLELDLQPSEDRVVAEEEIEPMNLVPKHPTDTGSDQSQPNLDSPSAASGDTSQGNRLNPKYTFESFVIGDSNRFAHAAARAVAESPGKSYNPLLIYGESGLGKTHLLHAIGHYVRNYYDRVRVKYVSTEEMTNDFISAISENRTAEFRAIYRDVDVLLIDDIQFLSSKVQTQEEFFHTFNTLHNAQKQIVMTSDRPPKELEALEHRLRSRFEMGLITDIQPPNLETRIAILRKKAQAESLVVPHEVLEYIANNIETNIRELEGALVRVTAYASLSAQPVGLDMAMEVLASLIPNNPDSPVTAQFIMEQTANYFAISYQDLISKSRTRSLVRPRQMAMYLCRELTELSLPKIGEIFGGKDHTTVMYAEDKIRKAMPKDRNLYNQVTELTSIIKHGTRNKSEK